MTVSLEKNLTRQNNFFERGELHLTSSLFIIFTLTIIIEEMDEQFVPGKKRIIISSSLLLAIGEFDLHLV